MAEDSKISELNYLKGTKDSYDEQAILNYLNDDNVEYLMVISQANQQTWKIPGHIIWNRIKENGDNINSLVQSINNPANLYVDGTVSSYQMTGYDSNTYKTFRITEGTTDTSSSGISVSNNVIKVPEKVKFLQLSINIQTKHTTNSVLEWFENCIAIGYTTNDTFTPIKVLKKEHTNDSSILDDTFTFSIKMSDIPSAQQSRNLELMFMCGFTGDLVSSSYQMSLVQI